MSKDNNGVMKLHGKTYFTVGRRVRDFRQSHPISEGWGLLTSMVHADAETVIFRAAIVNPDGREVAVGFAEEKRSSRGINATSALEKRRDQRHRSGTRCGWSRW